MMVFHERNKSCVKIGENSSQMEDPTRMEIIEAQKEFNKTGEIVTGRNNNKFLKPRITEEENESDEKPSENITDMNMC